MFLSHPHSPGPATSRGMRGRSWAVLALTGVLVLTALAGAVAGLNPWQLVGWLGLGVIGTLLFGAIATCHPLRGHPEALHLWQARFPNRTGQEFERFLRVVADLLLTSEKHLCRPRLDDRPAALTQEWLCGDGMDLTKLLLAVEQKYGLELPETFHERDRTLSDLFDHVTRHSDGRPPSPFSKPRNEAARG